MAILDVTGGRFRADRSVAPRKAFRYSLRTLIVAVTIICAWLGWNVRQVRTRETVRQDAASRGAIVRSRTAAGTPGALPLGWRLLGAEPVRAIELPGDIFNEQDLRRLQPWFPEADVTLFARGAGMM
jgi:hypothetical protein